MDSHSSSKKIVLAKDEVYGKPVSLSISGLKFGCDKIDKAITGADTTHDFIASGILRISKPGLMEIDTQLVSAIIRKTRVETGK